MRKRTIVLIILNLLLLGFLVGGFYFYRNNLIAKNTKETNAYKLRVADLQKQISEKDKKKDDDVFANITSDWKTYRDQGLGIQIDTPPKAVINSYSNDDTNRLVYFESEGDRFEVRLAEGKGKNGAGTFNIPFQEFYYLDFPIDSTVDINNMKFNIYKAPSGYCDGPGCGAPFISYATKKNDTFYIITFSGDAKLSGIEDIILKTFKII